MGDSKYYYHIIAAGHHDVCRHVRDVDEYRQIRELLVGYAIRASLGRFVSALTVTQLVTARLLPDEKWAALRPQLGSDQHHKH
jgi:hypothetical protein